MASNILGYKIDFTIPQGPVGNSSVVPVGYGGAYKNNLTIIRDVGSQVIPLNIAMLLKNITFNNTNYSLIVEEAGVYKISYYTNIRIITTGLTGRISVNVNKSTGDIYELNCKKTVYAVSGRELATTFFSKSAIVVLPAGTPLKLMVSPVDPISNYEVGYSSIIIERLA